MSRPFASRFPTAARLLGIADENDAAANEGGEDEGTETETDEEQDGEGDDAGGDDAGTGDEASGGEGEGEGDEANASALAGVLTASGPTDAQLMTAFEADAGRLVAAERQRCIAVFSSDAGKRNVEGAAMLLGDDDFASASAPKIIKLLGTLGGSSRSAARQALRDDKDTRVETGAASDTLAGATDAKTAHRARLAKRNPKKGGKKVGATSVDSED